MSIPCIVMLVVFNYIPMYGISLAFKNYKVNLGITGSPWIGLKHFKAFLSNPYATRTITNTLLLGGFSLLWGFPAPIILAFLFNELRNSKFKKFVQTVSCYPYFVSMVIIVGILQDFAATDGLFNNLRVALSLERLPFWLDPKYFRLMFISSGIWQSIGFGTIIYLAALSGVDVSLYDAADIDGAGRFHRILHISWPHIKPTVVMLLILAVGNVFRADTQKVLLMYSPQNYSTADVIGTLVYREGLLGARFEYSTAVGLFQTMVNFALLLGANYFSKLIRQESLF